MPVDFDDPVGASVTLVVEDGTGVANANTYNTLAELDEYHLSRGHTAWEAADVDTQSIAAVKATDYIERRFGRSFKGQRTTTTQTLSMPRTGIVLDTVYDGTAVEVASDEIPTCLKQAHAEYALRAITLVELQPDPPPTFAVDLLDGTTLDAGGAVESKRETVGPITEDVRYAPRDKGWWIAKYPIADELLQPLLKNGGVGGVIRN